MLVSIITPTYNSEQFVKETIESILAQTYANWELLITDDCSTDSTWRVIREYSQQDSRIKVFKLDENSGAGVARNNSIKEASGRFIAFCDSDDVWHPKKLELQINEMLLLNVELSYSSYDVINEASEVVGEVIAPREVSYKKMLRNNYIGCLTAIYDTNKLGKVYMPKVRKRQDWALWLKILKNEKVSCAIGIKAKLAFYRDRSGSISTNKIDLIKYNWNIYRNIEAFSVLKSVYYMFIFIFYYLRKKL